MGGFYWEVALQKREAEGKAHTKLQLNLDPNPERTQRNLDTDGMVDGKSSAHPARWGERGGYAECARLPAPAERTEIHLYHERFLQLTP